MGRATRRRFSATSDNAEFELPGQTTFTPGPVMVLGIDQNGPAGVLPPSYAGSITVNFIVPDAGTAKSS